MYRRAIQPSQLSRLKMAEPWTDSSSHCVIIGFRENHFKNTCKNFFWIKTPQLRTVKTFFFPEISVRLENLRKQQLSIYSGV